MDAWRSYPDFAHFFDALLKANDVSVNAFAHQYSQGTGNEILQNALYRIRDGRNQPTYNFVADIADHGLLSLDHERLRPATETLPAGDYRVALFASAGLIEVTPASIRQWNEEVLAAWQRRLNDSARPQLTWRQVMNKLLSFHSQGGRCPRENIATAIHNDSTSDHSPTKARIVNLLTQDSAVPSSMERLAVANAAGLTPSETELLESAIDGGMLLLTPAKSPSVFSIRLTDILGRLKAAGISKHQLALRSVSPVESQSGISGAPLSAWAHRNVSPTQASLHALIRALEQCRDQEGRRLVQDDEIRQLVESAGFTPEELTATTHDIIAGINGTTRLKPLLSDLRNAADLNVIQRIVAEVAAEEEPRHSGTRITQALLHDWERETSPWIATRAIASNPP